MPENQERRLAAILLADVVGYSRLMAVDEAGTLASLKSLQHNLVEPVISSHHGRIVDAPGDCILAEFQSVVEATKSAIKIQRDIARNNEMVPKEKRIRLRIGINLGDVIVSEDKIYGDGVNIAARLESLAEHGGICISRHVFEQVKTRVPAGYEDLGRHRVKNIPDPVEVYKVLLEPKLSGVIRTGKMKGKRRHLPVIVAFGAALLIAGLYFFPSRQVPHISPTSKSGSLPDTGSPSSLSAKPSIAVLPFANMSDDPEQEYFSDGITNDIITDLSKFPELSIIAHNTVFMYKGTSVDVTEMARKLDVRYVLEGSVQRAGEKVRINAQLIDGETGRHLWADRYERDFKDLFALQSELVRTIVTKMALQIDESERARAMRKDTESLEAYDYLLRGWDHFYRYTRMDNRNARLMFERALELDPRYSTALAALAWTYIYDFLFGWTQFPDKSLERAGELARDALSFQETNYLAHTALGYVYLRRAQYDLAVSELQRSIQLNPNDAESRSRLGSAMLYSGQPREAVRWKESALRLDPQLGPGTFMILGQAYYLLGEYDKAITILEKGLARDPNQTGNHIMLAASGAQAGLLEKAEHSAATVRRLNPFFQVDSYGTLFRNPEDRGKIIEGLRKAGLE